MMKLHKSSLTGLAALLLAAGTLSTVAQADTHKMMHGKSGKMVSLYQADKCHMYFTSAQAKKYGYACPDSKGKMKKVMVSAAVAKTEMAKTNAALAPKKAM